MDNYSYSIALQNVKQKREEYLSTYQSRQEKIYSEISEYRVAYDRFMNTTRNVFKGDFKSNIKLVEEEQKRLSTVAVDILNKYGYPSDYLTRKYYCDKCEDKDDYCSYCVAKEQNRVMALRLRKASSLSASFSFSTVNLEYYGEDKAQMEIIFEWCKNYAKKFTEKSKSLLMSGRTGLGKTHFSMSIANEVINNGYSVIYQSATEMFGQIEKEHFLDKDNKTETIDTMSSADLLIIDDLGVELDNKFYKAKLYEIIEKRINSGRPVIVNTNLNFMELSQKYGERIASRFSSFIPLNFVGNDIRQLKNVNGR